MDPIDIATVRALALVFASGAVLKLPDLLRPRQLRSTGLASILRGGQLLAAWMTIAVGELLVAVFLFARGTDFGSALLGLSVVTVGGAYMLASSVMAPNSRCGCMGPLSSKGIGSSALLRTAVLMLIALVPVAAPASGVTLQGNMGSWGVSIGLAAIVLLWEPIVSTLEWGLIPVKKAARTLWVRRVARDVATVRTAVTTSQAWAMFDRLIVAIGDSAPEVWIDGPSVFAAYPAMRDGRPVAAVFYLKYRVLRSRPEQVFGSLVDEEGLTTSTDGVLAASHGDFRWARPQTP